MHLSDLFDLEALDRHLDYGSVRDRTHPSLPFGILNYTEKAQYEGIWDAVTRTCRGLIYVAGTGEIVAWPYAKFFNHGQPEAGDLDLHAPVEVTDKADGSLGILYPNRRGGHAVATRGSFISDQAVHATVLYARRYEGRWSPDPALTYLYEIVYPANRIVLDYGGLDDLVLLGARHVKTGQTFGPNELSEWPGPRTETFAYGTLAEALAAGPRENAEGLVVRYLDDTGHMVKIKQEDYKDLHALVTGLNARVVWERLGAGESVAALCQPLPDEFHTWVKRVANDLFAARDDIVLAAHDEHARILASMPVGWTRKDYATEAAKAGHLRPWLFYLLDGKDPSARIWRTLRPSGEHTLVTVTEDAA